MTDPTDEDAVPPLMIFVTGFAATGKTTLALGLAEQFRLPLFHKDGFKEMMFDAACPDGDYENSITRETSHLLGRYSMGCLEIALDQCARGGVSAIFEANFDSRLFSPRIAAIRQRHPFRAVQVHLRCRSDVLFERFREREGTARHPGHGGLRHLDDFKAALTQNNDDPLALEASDDLVTLDTTNLATVNYDGLFELVQQQLPTSQTPTD
jgi:predicted kinase